MVHSSLPGGVRLITRVTSITRSSHSILTHVLCLRNSVYFIPECLLRIVLNIVEHNVEHTSGRCRLSARLTHELLKGARFQIVKGVN